MSPDLIELSGFRIKPLSSFHSIPEMLRFCLLVQACDNNGLGIKKIAKPITNQIINSLHIQLVGQPFLNTVYYSKFSITLFCLFSKRCVSSKWRAFSKATLILLASVSSNLISDSLNAFSLSTFC